MAMIEHRKRRKETRPRIPMPTDPTAWHEERKRRNREFQRERRARDYEHVRALEKQHEARKKITTKLWMERTRQNRVFKWFTYKYGHLKPFQLASLYHKQNGRCALTGRKLARETMQLDHIIPTARGGNDGLENLRWVCKEANEAKNALLDAEFIQLCKDVIAFTEREPWR